MVKDDRRYILGVDLMFILAAIVAGIFWYVGVREIRKERREIMVALIEHEQEMQPVVRLLKALANAAGIDSSLIETPKVDSLGTGP